MAKQQASGSGMGFPRRMHLLCGDRWALAYGPRPGLVRSEISAVPSEVLAGKQCKKNDDTHWCFSDVASNGVLIRSDRGVLTVADGNRVVLDPPRRICSRQRWQLVYSADSSAERIFHILNASCGVYLTVDDATGQLVLQRKTPDLHWHWRDASGKAGAHLRRVATKLFSIRAFRKVLPVDDVVSVAARAKADAPLLPLVQRRTVDVENLSMFNGDLASAWQNMPPLGEGFSCNFTALKDLRADSLPLFKDVQLTDSDPAVNIETLFGALFGPHSDFRRVYLARRRVKQSQSWPSAPIKDQPWLHMSHGVSLAPLPILGFRPCREMSRYALCQEGGRATLALQYVSIMQAHPVGDLKIEVLYLLTQAPDNGPLLLEGIIANPRSRFRKLVIDGIREASNDFIVSAREVLGSLSEAQGKCLRKSGTAPLAMMEQPTLLARRSVTAPLMAKAVNHRPPLPLPASTEGCCSAGIARLLGW